MYLLAGHPERQGPPMLPAVLPVGSLTPGDRFRLAALPDKRGVVVRIGTGSAVVRYGEPHHVTLPNGVEFDAKADGLTISLGTLVTIEEPAP